MADSVIGAQLFTLRDFVKTPPDVAETFRKLRAIGFEAVQVSGVGPIDPHELKRIADGEGLAIAATHGSFERMRDDTAAFLDEHQLWNCRYSAIGMIPEAYSTRGAEGYREFARVASEVGRKLKDGGVTFGYHNHGFELVRYGKRTGLDILMEESDPEAVTFEIDTYWIQFGGGNPVTWIRKAQNRMPLVHLKDILPEGWGQKFAEVGEGNLEWASILPACRESGAVWYLIEQDKCERDPFDCLKTSLDNLRAMGLW